jgi:hypothetical protein
MARPRRFPAARQADNADFGNVSLEKGVCGLRRAVRDQNDFVGVDAPFLQKLKKRGNDAVSNAFFGAVGGGSFNLRDEGEFLSFNRYGMGKGAANVDANADFSHEVDISKICCSCSIAGADAILNGNHEESFLMRFSHEPLHSKYNKIFH